MGTFSQNGNCLRRCRFNRLNGQFCPFVESISRIYQHRYFSTIDNEGYAWISSLFEDCQVWNPGETCLRTLRSTSSLHGWKNLVVGTKPQRVPVYIQISFSNNSWSGCRIHRTNSDSSDTNRFAEYDVDLGELQLTLNLGGLRPNFLKQHLGFIRNIWRESMAGQDFVTVEAEPLKREEFVYADIPITSARASLRNLCIAFLVSDIFIDPTPPKLECFESIDSFSPFPEQILQKLPDSECVAIATGFLDWRRRTAFWFNY